MAHKLRTLVLVLALTTGTQSLQSHASGIPTVDLAAIAQAVTDAMQQAQEAAANLTALQDQLDEAKRQFDETKGLITGNSRYGSKFNDPAMYDYLPTSTTAGSWEDIYSKMDAGTLNSYRGKYGLVTKNASQQAVFDKQLTNLRTQEAAYRANNLRLENLRNLQALADSARTPQEKQDIQSRLQIEQANIANEANRLATTKDLMERQDKLLAQKQNTDFNSFLSGE